MTGIELVLLIAIGALSAQVLILQRHYADKLADQAVVLSYLFERLCRNRTGAGQEDQETEVIREKIFHSSR